MASIHLGGRSRGDGKISRLEKNETKTFEAETARKPMILPQNLVRLGKKRNKWARIWTILLHISCVELKYYRHEWI